MLPICFLMRSQLLSENQQVATRKEIFIFRNFPQTLVRDSLVRDKITFLIYHQKQSNMEYPC